MSARRRRWTAVPASLATALVVLLTGVLGPAAAVVPAPDPRAAAAGTAPRPTPTPGRPSSDVDDDAPAVRVEVTEVSPQVLRPADELVVRATLSNTGDTELAQPHAALRVSRFLQATRGSLEQWTSQSLDETAGTRVRDVPLAAPLAPGESVEVELRVPATALRLSTAHEAWGPRGLSVEITDAGRRVGILRTFVLWMPTEQPIAPTRVSVLVPLTGGPADPTVDPSADLTTDPTTDPPAGTTDPATDPAADPADPADPVPDPDADPAVEPGAGGTRATAVPGALSADVVRRLDDVVDATGGVPAVSWAVDPALLAAARLPDAGPAAARWVTGLTAAAPGRDVFALPLRDPDLAALAHGGGERLASLATTAAAAAVDPVLGTPVRTDLAWPAAAVPDVATVGLAARTGATSVVVAEDALLPEELTYTPTGRATIATPAGPVAALVADDVLSDELVSPRDATGAAAAQRVLAETAVVTRERPIEQRHLLVAADREWVPDAPLAAAQLAALDTAPWVDLTPLSTLIGAADPGVDREPLDDRRVDEGEMPPSAVQSLLRARADLEAFSTVVADPSVLVGGTDDAVLAPTSVAWRSDPDQRAAVVDAVVADLAARRAGVSIVPGSAFLLLSETGRFPVGVRNDLAQDATVQVAVDPAGSPLVVEGPETVTVPAGSETQTRIPFRAVGSGDVVVEVSLLTPDGVPLGAPQRFTVRVRADWENVGTAVVAAVLGVALVVGIIRTIRRGQTSRRGAGSTPVDQIAALPRDES